MADKLLNVCVVGAAGRMGRRTTDLIVAWPGVQLSAAVDTVAAAQVHSDLTADLVAALGDADVVIDFSAPPACAMLAVRCAEEGVAYLVASTALSDLDLDAITRASKKVPVLRAANLSIGVNAMAELVENAVRRLPDFDVEIVEIHHRHKRDAPSGTAHLLAEAARAARGDLRTVCGRSGTAVRANAEVGISAARGGDVSGEHTIYLLGEGERIELVHRATTPDIFARGALRAAAWLAHRGPGLYGMRDVVG